MSELIESLAQESAGAIKKIRAAKGRLSGNFYFAGDGKSSAGIIVTLAARDPSGGKALSKGKGLRKEIRGAKFGRGTVSAEGGKLRFSLHSGSASADVIKRAFKKQLGDLGGLKLLKKAAVAKASGPVEAEPEDTSAEPDDETSADEAAGVDRAELEQLIADQGAITDLSAQLKTFLSQEDSDRERGEQVAEQLDEIERLKHADPPDVEAIQAARRDLAASAFIGDAPLPEPGEPVSPEVQELLSASMSTARRGLQKHIAATTARVQALTDQIEEAEPSWRAENRAALLAELSQYRDTLSSYQDRLRDSLRL